MPHHPPHHDHRHRPDHHTDWIDQPAGVAGDPLRHRVNGAPPKRHILTMPAPNGGRKPGIARCPTTRVDQGMRIVALIQLAMRQKKHPHIHLTEVDKATWNVGWLWVILVLLTARAILLAVDDSDVPVIQRCMVWDLINYAKKQAASIHSRFPRKPESADKNAALWGTYLG